MFAIGLAIQSETYAKYAEDQRNRGYFDANDDDPPRQRASPPAAISSVGKYLEYTIPVHADSPPNIVFIGKPIDRSAFILSAVCRGHSVPLR